MNALTFEIAAGVFVVFGCLSYFFYFKKIQAPNPIKKAAILGGVSAVLTIIIGWITE